MKILVTILSSMLIATTTLAAAPAAKKPAAKPLTPEQKRKMVLQNLANLQVKADVRTVIKYAKEEGSCGSPAPSYIIEIQVNKYEKKVVNPDYGPEIIDNWVTVKQYGISEAEVGDGSGISPLPIDADRCL